MMRTVFSAALCASLAVFSAPLAAQETPSIEAQLDAQLDALDTRITRLEDMGAIEKVQRTYGYFVDKGQWTHLANLFAEDSTLEIGGKGIFLGRDRVLEYMQTAFGDDGPPMGIITNHMQFQTITDISPDGKTGWLRGRAYVMSSGGWGLPLYEDEFVKEDGIWKIKRLTGPFTMYTNWDGWAEYALNNTWPDKFDPAPDLPPSVVYLTYPAYYIVPFHYPHPVTGEVLRPDMSEVGAYHRPPGTAQQYENLTIGRTVNGSQPIAEFPKD